MWWFKKQLPEIHNGPYQKRPLCPECDWTPDRIKIDDGDWPECCPTCGGTCMRSAIGRAQYIHKPHSLTFPNTKIVRFEWKVVA